MSTVNIEGLASIPTTYDPISRRPVTDRNCRGLAINQPIVLSVSVIFCGKVRSVLPCVEPLEVGLECRCDGQKVIDGMTLSSPFFLPGLLPSYLGDALQIGSAALA